MKIQKHKKSYFIAILILMVGCGKADRVEVTITPDFGQTSKHSPMALKMGEDLSQKISSMSRTTFSNLFLNAGCLQTGVFALYKPGSADDESNSLVQSFQASIRTPLCTESQSICESWPGLKAALIQSTVEQAVTVSIPRGLPAEVGATGVLYPSVDEFTTVNGVTTSGSDGICDTHTSTTINADNATRNYIVIGHRKVQPLENSIATVPVWTVRSDGSGIVEPEYNGTVWSNGNFACADPNVYRSCAYWDMMRIKMEANPTGYYSNIQRIELLADVNSANPISIPLSYSASPSLFYWVPSLFPIRIHYRQGPAAASATAAEVYLNNTPISTPPGESSYTVPSGPTIYFKKHSKILQSIVGAK